MNEKLQSEQAIISRRPIVSKNLDVVAYELFCQNNSAEFFALVSDQVDALLGDRQGLIHLNIQDLEQAHQLPKSQLTLSIQGNLLLDTRVASEVIQLAEEGHAIAIDNFEYHDTLEPLLDLADIVKLNMLKLDKAELIYYAAKLDNFVAKTLINDVNSYEDFEVCSELNFDYYEGFFLSKPKLKQQKKITANKLVVLKFLNACQNPTSTPDELVNTLSQDPRLSYKLLRMINSAAYALPRKIESLKEAIILLGFDQLRTWASLLSLATLEDKPHELIIMTMMRAKMCERLAEYAGLANMAMCFTAGMFSALDALLDQPMENIVNEMPLHSDLKGALLDHAGIVGIILRNVIAYERAEWSAIDIPGVSLEQTRLAYIDSISFSGKAAAVLYGA